MRIHEAPTSDDTGTVPAATAPKAAVALGPLLDTLVAGSGVRVELWDGSAYGPAEPGPGTIVVRSPQAVRRMLWSPGELGLGRAYVAGELDARGDLFELIRALRPAGRTLRSGANLAVPALRAARRLDLLGPPPPPPPEEMRALGRRHSKSRDASAISHHYDVDPSFYALVLGPSMTYSCARFATPETSLEDAQASKYELICRKLALHERPGQRLLDVGCGWGSMAIHAATRHQAEVVGVTISRDQLASARARVAAAGLADRVEIRLQDYRDVRGEHFDAICSIGMAEHVGLAKMGEYFSTLYTLLGPHGRLLNHAISSPGTSRLGGRTFMHRYIFPDAELLDVAESVRQMEDVGFEVRDVESLREHYAVTLRRWVANLEAHWDEAVAIVGERRARAWKLYMVATSVGFSDGGLAVHQVLGVRPDADGGTGMPHTRDGWATG